MLALACLGHQLPIRRAAPSPRHARATLLIHEHAVLLADLDVPDPAAASAAASAVAADLDAGLKSAIGQLKSFSPPDLSGLKLKFVFGSEAHFYNDLSSQAVAMVSVS